MLSDFNPTSAELRSGRPVHRGAFSLALACWASLLAACADQPAPPRADGSATLDGVPIWFDRSQFVSTQTPTQIFAVVTTSDGTESLEVIAAVDLGSTVTCNSAGLIEASIQYRRADGVTFTGNPAYGGDCTLLFSSGYGEGDGYASVYLLSGTLVTADGTETLTLSGGYLTVYNFDGP